MGKQRRAWTRRSRAVGEMLKAFFGEMEIFTASLGVCFAVFHQFAFYRFVCIAFEVVHNKKRLDDETTMKRCAENVEKVCLKVDFETF